MENERRMRELYVMALYATRAVEPEDSGEHEVALRVAMAVSANGEEAKARGMRQLLVLCPPEEGWVNHHVTASLVTEDELRRVFAALADDAPDDDEDDSAGVPELIM